MGHSKGVLDMLTKCSTSEMVEPDGDSALEETDTEVFPNLSEVGGMFDGGLDGIDGDPWSGTDIGGETDQQQDHGGGMGGGGGGGGGHQVVLHMQPADEDADDVQCIGMICRCPECLIPPKVDVTEPAVDDPDDDKRNDSSRLADKAPVPPPAN